ncbi:MAG: hypothetical protein ACE14S_08505 [Candidatus Bathyarchaeia archaeon]
MTVKRFGVFLVCLLVAQILLSSSYQAKAQAVAQPDVFVGIDVAYENLDDIKQLVDEVSGYTNLFVIGCSGITRNITRTDELSQYLHDRGLYTVAYLDYPPSSQWLDRARGWGDRFLGFYAYDEPGGRQLDQAEGYMAVLSAADANDAAAQFITATNGYIRADNRYAFAHNFADPSEFQLFCGDYALYWFDYKAGFDTMWAEFGWNYSRQLNVALCRGAATVQNKDWGVIIAWTYTVPPYIESGAELYADLVYAYESGAKYIVLFDSNEEYTEGILQQEHLDALKQFWQYIQSHPRTAASSGDRTAFVLPLNYAFGFRGPDDKIWGLWEANDFSYELSRNVNGMLELYGDKLDLVYDDGLQGNNGYSQLIYWNDPSFQPEPLFPPTPPPMPTPTATAAPTPTPTSTSTPTPSSTSSPTLSPTQLSTQSPPASPPQTSPPSTEPSAGLPLPIEFMYVAIATLTVAAVVGVGVAFWRRSRRSRG